ncbi:hypothetical protein ACG7TL_005912 [Trametes sanguinea]
MAPSPAHIYDAFASASLIVRPPNAERPRPALTSTGETLELKAALIEATDDWRALSGTDAPCPVQFDAEDVQETMRLEAEQQEADEVLQDCLDLVGAGTDGWVPVGHYEEAMARSKRLKEDALASATSDQERAEVTAHWPLDDMDETSYM